MIEVEDLRGLAQNEILDLLLDQKIQPFQIYIPKSTQLFFSEKQAIVEDYYSLAYCGQKLSDASDEFNYEEVSPDLCESVLFEVRTNKLEELAEALLEISYGYVNDHEDEEFIFAELVDDIAFQVDNKSIVAACPYFVTIYKQFEKEIEEEESEGND